jgi:hypothetical protein
MFKFKDKQNARWMAPWRVLIIIIRTKGTVSGKGGGILEDIKDGQFQKFQKF